MMMIEIDERLLVERRKVSHEGILLGVIYSGYTHFFLFIIQNVLFIRFRDWNANAESSSVIQVSKEFVNKLFSGTETPTTSRRATRSRGRRREHTFPSFVGQEIWYGGMGVTYKGLVLIGKRDEMLRTSIGTRWGHPQFFHWYAISTIFYGSTRAHSQHERTTAI